MKVLVAKKRGFCFGVEHAIETAEKLLAECKKVYCLGPLIHNSQVVDKLGQSSMGHPPTFFPPKINEVSDTSHMQLFVVKSDPRGRMAPAMEAPHRQ